MTVKSKDRTKKNMAEYNANLFGCYVFSSKMFYQHSTSTWIHATLLIANCGTFLGLIFDTKPSPIHHLGLPSVWIIFMLMHNGGGPIMATRRLLLCFSQFVCLSARCFGLRMGGSMPLSKARDQTAISKVESCLIQLTVPTGDSSNSA